MRWVALLLSGKQPGAQGPRGVMAWAGQLTGPRTVRIADYLMLCGDRRAV